MSTITVRESARSLEAWSWLGLAAGLVAALAGTVVPRPTFIGYAALSPQELSAWVSAVCSAVGLITATANGVALVVHRWRKRPARKPRRRKARPDAPPPG